MINHDDDLDWELYDIVRDYSRIPTRKARLAPRAQRSPSQNSATNDCADGLLVRLLLLRCYVSGL